jgi:hypothetical protein
MLGMTAAAAVFATRARARLRVMVLLSLALGVVGCGGRGVPCRYSDMDDHMMSTRTAFLERMAGCPIGGRH